MRRDRRPVHLVRADLTDHRCAADGVSAMAVPTSTYQSMTPYQRDIDRWIIGAYRGRRPRFLAPGFPAPSSLPDHCATGCGKIDRSIGHPCVSCGRAIDVGFQRCIKCGGSWLANPKTHLPSIGVTPRIPQGSFWNELLHRLTQHKRSACWGHRRCIRWPRYGRRLGQCILLDQNGSLSIDGPQSLVGSIFRRCHMQQDAIDLPRVQAVLADPPWYEDETLAFLRTSARICADQGKVLLSAAPDGVRPGIQEERDRIITGAAESGLRFLGTERRVLSYATPFF